MHFIFSCHAEWGIFADVSIPYCHVDFPCQNLHNRNFWLKYKKFWFWYFNMFDTLIFLYFAEEIFILTC